jgi:HTH-type transcriptional repressor of NAD biosynthesis genes
VSAAPFTVVLLGGESTGKSQLALALQARLGTAHELRCLVVAEHLREWCEQQGRAPAQSEQAAIAETQDLHIAQARATPGVQVLLADTSGVMVAAYSEQYFNDTSLWPQALAGHAAAADLTLLMGLDLPWVPDGLFRDSPAARQTTDAILRARLEQAGISFQTIYGSGEARVQQALRTLGAAMGHPLVAQDPFWEQGRRRWNCEKCSDPECEHRLFRDLIAQRQPPT